MAVEQQLAKVLAPTNKLGKPDNHENYKTAQQSRNKGGVRRINKCKAKVCAGWPLTKFQTLKN